MALQSSWIIRNTSPCLSNSILISHLPFGKTCLRCVGHAFQSCLHACHTIRYLLQYICDLFTSCCCRRYADVMVHRILTTVMQMGHDESFEYLKSRDLNHLDPVRVIIICLGFVITVFLFFCSNR